MDKWRLALCTRDDTVETALRRIDRAGTQMCFVVDENNRLIGTLSDGDIRRGLLSGRDLSSLAGDLMTTQPVSAQLSNSRREIRELFEKFKVNLIPIIDATGKIVDVLSLASLSQRSEISNQIVIMAGGLGTRLLPLTKEIPKPLIEVGGKPILETIIRIASDQGFKNFVLSVGYKAEMIQDYFGDGSAFDVQIEYVKEEQSLGTAGALSLFEEIPTEPFLVMNGDVLNRVDLLALLRNHLDSDNYITVAARYLETQIPYGVIENNAGKLYRMVEKPILRHLINTGIYACSPKVLQFCKKNEPLAMTDLISNLLQENHPIGVFETNSYWLDVGQFEELAKAKTEWELGHRD